MKLMQELLVLTEAKADVQKSIAYLQGLGLKVSPEPVENKNGEISFKVIGKNGHEVIAMLDRISFDDDEDETSSKNKNKKLYIGQGTDSAVQGRMDMEYADKSGEDWNRTLHVVNTSKSECIVVLSDRSGN